MKIRMSRTKNIEEKIEKLENEKDIRGFYNWVSMDEIVEYLDNMDVENIIDDENGNKMKLIEYVVSYKSIDAINADLELYEKDLEVVTCTVMRIIFDRILVLLDILDYEIDEE